MTCIDADDGRKVSSPSGIHVTSRPAAMHQLTANSRAEAMSAAPRSVGMQWWPAQRQLTTDAAIALVVARGDLTACPADAVVNPANGRLSHGGGLAAALVRKGGRSIQDESVDWITHHGELAVGAAMSTCSGDLPSRYVIHAFGPNVGRVSSRPTREHAEQLRSAVWNALAEATRLQVASIAIPGISSGTFGYPRDAAAKEIVAECERFCCERAMETSVRLIVLMNIDEATFRSFMVAGDKAVKRRGGKAERVAGDPFANTSLSLQLPASSRGAKGAPQKPRHDGFTLDKANTSHRETLKPASESDQTVHRAAGELLVRSIDGYIETSRAYR